VNNIEWILYNCLEKFEVVAIGEDNECRFTKTKAREYSYISINISKKISILSKSKHKPKARTYIQIRIF